MSLDCPPVMTGCPLSEGRRPCPCVFDDCPHDELAVPSGTTKHSQCAVVGPSFLSHMSFQDMVLYSPFLVYLPGLFHRLMVTCGAQVGSVPLLRPIIVFLTVRSSSQINVTSSDDDILTTTVLLCRSILQAYKISKPLPIIRSEIYVLLNV